MKTKLYRKALKLFYKWGCPLSLHTPFWIPVWDDVLFWFNRHHVASFTSAALSEFNYLSWANIEYDKLDPNDWELCSWRKFLEDNKRYRRRYWDADAMLKRAIAGEGDVER